MECSINCDHCNYNYAVEQVCLANNNDFIRKTTNLEKLAIICKIELTLIEFRKFYNIK
jgi:hypothetical protein